jgi:isopentenyldiphosphate isomerase
LTPAREAEKRWRYSSVDSSVVEYSPDSNDMSTEAEVSPLLRAVTMQQQYSPESNDVRTEAEVSPLLRAVTKQQQYSPDSNDVSTEAEVSPLLRAVTKKRLVKTLQAGEDLTCSDL